MVASYTLAEVTKRTGAKRRSVQMWADAVIIHAIPDTDRAGTGVHRRFDSDELKIVALLASLADWGMPIGWLKHFALRFREALRGKTKKGKAYTTAQELERALNRAIAGKGNNYLLFGYSKNQLWFEVVTDRLKPANVNLTKCFELALSRPLIKLMGVLDLNAALLDLRE